MTLTFLRLARAALAGRLPLSLPPHAALLFLQPLLLSIGLVPAAVLHQSLVRSQTAVGGSHAILRLIKGERQRGEEVGALCTVTAGEQKKTRIRLFMRLIREDQ